MSCLESFRDGRYDPRRGRLRSWLRGIVVNKVREARRRLAKLEVQVANGTDSTGFMDGIADERELTDAFDDEWEHGVLEACLRDVRQQVDRHSSHAIERRLRAFELSYAWFWCMSA